MTSLAGCYVVRFAGRRNVDFTRILPIYPHISMSHNLQPRTRTPFISLIPYCCSTPPHHPFNPIPTTPTIHHPSDKQPSAFLSAHTDSMSSNPQAKIKLAHGTTTLAFRFQGGIIVAVDSRATAGSYIASGTVKKVIEINPYLLGTMAGGAADCQYW